MAIFFMVLLSAGVLLSQSTTPERILERAIQFQQKNDLEAAIREYRAFLELRPGVVEARSNLGAALAKQGRYEEAIAEYELALKASPGNASVQLNLGLAHYKAGQFPEAVRAFSAILMLQPDDYRATLLLADCELRMGEYQRVTELLQPLEPKAGGDLALAYLLGIALIREHQVERGQVLIDRILRHGDSAEARVMMATAKSMSRDFRGAATDLARAVELNPKLPGVYSYYGLALLHTADPSGAMTAFQQQLKNDPNDFEANVNVGALLKNDARFDDAMPYLDRALRLRPGSIAARYQIALVHRGKGDLEGARSELEQIVSEAPDFQEAHVSLATVYYRLGRKADGDRHKAIVEKLTAAQQPQKSGLQESESLPR